MVVISNQLSNHSKTTTVTEELPRYPMVTLDEAVKDHFAKSPEETDDLNKAARELIAPNSLGRNIYNNLGSKAEGPEGDIWIAASKR
jgi:hypothetical protein